MDEYNHFPPKINSEALFAEFLEKNKEKIPEDVIVERVEPGHHVLQNNSGEGKLVIHAFALSLGLYLPLNPLISEILSKRGLDPIQLVPNCWRIMFSIVALNQYFCKTKLGWKEFCYCYVVKKNPAGLYYFSPRQKGYALVKNLPNSEKGWQHVYISLKGNWGGARNENTSGEPGGANYSCWKPRDEEVNSEDLKKALSFKNKDWRYLLNPANWGNDGAAVAGSSLLTEARATENTDNEVVEQPGREIGLVDDQMTTNDSLSFQPHSKKQKTNHDSGSGGVAHDDRHIMNSESTPYTRVCGGQEDAGDLLSHQILPNHSHFQSTDNISPQLQHSVTPRAGNEQFTLILRLLSMMVESKNETIIELRDSKRREKELAESKSSTCNACKEAVGAVTEYGKLSTAEQFERLWSKLTQNTKDIEELRSELTQKTKDIEELRSELTQKTKDIEELRSHGQINEQPHVWMQTDRPIYTPYTFMPEN